MINYQLITEQKIKNNNDIINKKFEEMSNMIKNLHEDIISLKDSNNKLQDSNNKIQENCNKLQESHNKLQDNNNKILENYNKLQESHNKLQEEIININDDMDNININIKEIILKLELGGKIEDKLNDEINIILYYIQCIFKEVNEIKENFNSQIEELKNEKNKLEEKLKQIENKINELQGIIIGRKIIKIIIKKILTNCFINYKIQLNTKGIYEIKNVTLKDIKYLGMDKVINHLIEAITNTKGIIHIIDVISNSITVINKNTTFGDIINICEAAIKQVKKNDINIIKSLFSDNSILNNNIYQEIIWNEPKIKDLLSEYLEKK